MLAADLAKLAGNALLSVLWAPQCAACGVILETPVDGPVCRFCWRSIPPTAPPTPGSRSRAIGEYEGALRAIIHAFKYDGRRSLATGLAERMRGAGLDVLAQADCVVPVPLHRRRERTRGFNQARELARRLGPPVVDALVRRRPTRSQVELPADRRRANVRHAFRMRRRLLGPGVRMKGLTVVLVDDVQTTGATLDACAAVLEESGAARIYTLTAARVSALRR